MLAGVKMSMLMRPRHLANSNIGYKPTVGNYIIKSLVDKNVNIAFGYKKAMNRYTSFFKTADEHENFDIIFENYEETAGYNAVTYSKINSKLGVVIDNSSYGFGHIFKPIEKAKHNMYPVLLLSFFDENHELKVSSFPGEMRRFIKQSVTIKSPDNFPAEMEGLLSYCFEHPAGPVHLNVSNQVLDKPLNFGIKEQNDNPTLLQYLEKQYSERQSEVEFSQNVCKMHAINFQKQRNSMVKKLV
jgi:thiamine pyrophosphate-dependent acetolactate synthase large subunit-like protein